MSENQGIQKVNAEVVQGRRIGLAEIMFDLQKFEQVKQIANVFYHSALVPAAIRGKNSGEGIANIILAFSLASEMQENPLILMQNVFFVGGTPGWKTQYMIAKANRSKIFAGRINWRTTNPDGNLTVTAFAKLASTGEDVEVSVDMAMARAEDWTRNAKYKSMPEHMLRWRAAAFLIRLYAPEIMLGYSTVEELETMRSIPSPASDSKVQDLMGALGLPAPGQVIDAEEGAPFDEEIPPPDDDPKPPSPPPSSGSKPTSGADVAKLQSMAPAPRAKEEPPKAPPAPAGLRLVPPTEVVDAVFVEEQKSEPPKPAPAPAKPKSDPTPEAKPNSPVDVGFDAKKDSKASSAPTALESEVEAVFAEARALKVEEKKIEMWQSHILSLLAKGDSRFDGEFARFKDQVAKKRNEAAQAALKASGVTPEQIAQAYSQAYDLALAQGDDAGIEEAARLRNAGDAVGLAGLLASLKARANAPAPIQQDPRAIDAQTAFDGLASLAEQSRNRDAWIIQGRKALASLDVAELQRLTSDLKQVLVEARKSAVPAPEPAQPAAPPAPAAEPKPRAISLIDAAVSRKILSEEEGQGFRTAYLEAPDQDAAAEEEDAMLEALAEREGSILLDAARKAGLVSPQPKREWLKAAPQIEGGAWDRGIKYLIGKGLAVKHGTGSGSRYAAVPAKAQEPAVLTAQAVLDVSDEELDHAFQSAMSMNERALDQGVITDSQAAQGSNSIQVAFEGRDVAKLRQITDAIDRRATSMGVLL